jgi:hypothetical protein
MGMPKKLFQEMMRQSPARCFSSMPVDSGLWMRANDNQPPLQSD